MTEPLGYTLRPCAECDDDTEQAYDDVYCSEGRGLLTVMRCYTCTVCGHVEEVRSE